jgi:hypothetical protein
MIEETILDSSGSTIELIYDVDNDIVKIKKLLVDTDFREVKRLNTFNPNIVIGLETPNDDDDDGWEDYTDIDTRAIIRLFWETHKVNKD